MNKNLLKQPLVSVVMPVYNAGKFLPEAIESILGQTYQNFEFIIVDDHSSDNSFKVLSSYAKKDKRIKLFRNAVNLGISNTVKSAIDNTKGIFIARMDADDIAYNDRLEKQITYLQIHPQTVAVGAQCLLIDENGRTIGRKKFPLSYNEIYKYIFQFVPLQQPTLTIARKRLPQDFEYYKDGMNTAEEIELIFKLFKYGKVENLSNTLLKYRIHTTNTSFKNIKTTFFLTLLSRIKAVFVYGYQPTFKGIMVTMGETILVLILPKIVLMYIYTHARHLTTTRALLLAPLSYLKTTSLSLRSIL